MSGGVSQVGRFEFLKAFATLGIAFLIAMGVAAATIGLAPKSAIDPGLRTLSTQGDATWSPAALASNGFGCLSSRRMVAAAGSRSNGQLVCDE